MGHRTRPPRSTNPLIIAASAVSRSLEHTSPSRLTTLRLLADALLLFSEASAGVKMARARTAAMTAQNANVSKLPSQARLDADIIQGHALENGARALVSAAISCLLTLPSRAGALRRRAMHLLSAAADCAGPATLLQAAERTRLHIQAFRRSSDADTEADFASAVLTLAEVSRCTVAGRTVAKDSIVFLLGSKAGPRSSRSDIALAVALILQSYPAHFGPEDSLIDSILEFALSHKHRPSTGLALLVATAAPHLLSRTPQDTDRILTQCARALLDASPTERAAWALAIARVAVIGRQSRMATTTENGLDHEPPSQQVFEAALVYVARLTGLVQTRAGCGLCLAALLRMWASALPQNVAQIPARTISLLVHEVTSVAGASSLRDALVYGVLEGMEPSLAHATIERIQSTGTLLIGLPSAISIDLCAMLVRRFGEQGIIFDDEDPSSLGRRLVDVSHQALSTNFSAVRLAGVRLMSAIAQAFPRLRVPLVTAVLQNMRIADLSLATKPHQVQSADSTSQQSNTIAGDLSAILGNAAALATLLEDSKQDWRDGAPAALVQQCVTDSLSLLAPVPLPHGSPNRGLVPSQVRRRAAWGIIAALARVGALEKFIEGGLSCLLRQWRTDLGQGRELTRDEPVPFKADADSAFPIGDTSQDTEGPAVTTQNSITRFDELIATTATRTAALSALAACLEHQACIELRQFAPSLIGACAARVVTERSRPQDIAADATKNANSSQGSSKSVGGPVFYRASLNSDISLAPTNSPGTSRGSYISRLWAAESIQIARCVALAPPSAASGTLCYYISIACGEDAQKALGDAVGVPGTGGSVSQFISPFPRATTDHTGMVHRKLSLSTLQRGLYSMRNSCSPPSSGPRPGLAKNDSPGSDSVSLPVLDLGWVFSTEGIEMPIAEEALVISAEAIAAVVVADLLASGSVLESLSSAGSLSPTFSAAIALALSRRISKAGLAETGRASATLQVLVGRALTGTVTVHESSSQGKQSAKAPPVEGYSNGMCLGEAEYPGSALWYMAGSSDWFSWARRFSTEGQLSGIPYNDELSRTLGIVLASRALAAEAYRELAMKGGARMWLGLTRNVTNSLMRSLHGKSPSQITLAATSATVLGSLVEAIPVQAQCVDEGKQTTPVSSRDPLSSEVAQVAKSAVDALAEAIDIGQSYVQTAAAVAISDSSSRIATNSERLVAALLHAWSLDKGVDGSPARCARCAIEAGFWTSGSERIWNGMANNSTDKKAVNKPFLVVDAGGYSSVSPALAIGAAAVLSSCLAHKWEFGESSAVAASELCSELVHWTGTASLPAQAAGLYGLTEMWAARIAVGQVQNVVGTKPRSPKLQSRANGTKPQRSSEPYVPIEFFSIREPSQAGSSAGLYLEDVLYGALNSGRNGVKCGVQMSALSAIRLLIKEAGREAVCQSFLRLPENLFIAVHDGLVECHGILEHMADKDGVKRPRYWIGLCRAVGLGGRRLNTGTKNAVWDVNLATRRLALRITRIAVTSSIAKCKCAATWERVAEPDDEDPPEHICALGCLKETLGYILSALRVSPVDEHIAEEVCGLLDIVASLFQDSDRVAAVGPTAERAFQDFWVPIASTLCKLLMVRHSHRVVQAAASTACQWLLTSSLMTLKNMDAEVSRLCKALFGVDGPRDIAYRFRHFEQSEIVSTDTTLAVLSSLGRLVTVRGTQAQITGASALDSEISSHIMVLKSLFYAACGDFVTTLSATACEATARRGGALSSGDLNAQQLRESYAKHIEWIATAANALAGVEESGNLNIKWCSESAPYLELRHRDDDKKQQRSDAVCFATLLWLAHSRKELCPNFSLPALPSFCEGAAFSMLQCLTGTQEALQDAHRARIANNVGIDDEGRLQGQEE